MLLKHIAIKLIALMGIVGCLIIVFLLISGKNNGKALAAVANCKISDVDTSFSTLELVHILMRHGARTPVNTYPNDPYVNYTFYPTGWGHLTNKGKLELFELGKWLKWRYRKFLPSYYIPDALHAQSTASPRVLMSLSTVLASMFPPQKTAMDWNSELNWQPIPIVSQPLAEDTLLLVRTACPRYAEAREEVFQLPEVKADLARYEPLFKNLSRLTGMPIKTAEDVNSIYITLLAEQDFGLKLPEWTKMYFPDKMQYLAERSYIYNAYTPEMQKIKGGPFLQKMFKEMLAKSENKLKPAQRQLYIYAGHDWTIGNILSALQVWEPQMPRFAATAIFELHRNRQTGEYYVQIFLRNSENGCPVLLTVPQCSKNCPLQKLLKLTEHIMPHDSAEERCRPRDPEFKEPQSIQIDQVKS